MWNSLPYDLLSHIFSFLLPHSLASAKSACRNWRQCPTSRRRRHQSPWFLAVPSRNWAPLCYAQNPDDDTNRYILHLDFIPTQIRLASAIGELILFRPTATSAALQLAVCNPFTRQFRLLPPLNVARTNPAVGAMELTQSHFRIYVVGGNGGGCAAAYYEPTMEMYDSGTDTWVLTGPVPMEYAVRLTVWTPNDSVFCNGILYWMTSARAYSVMGFEIGTNKWTELSVPIADRLEFAALVRRRNGRLTLLGGKCGGDAYAWELGEARRWRVVEKVPYELGMKFLGGKGCWDNTKCAGSDGVVFLYRDLGSGMLVWREREGVDNGGIWEWDWVDGSCSIRENQVTNLQIKGMLLHPNLDRNSAVFDSCTV